MPEALVWSQGLCVGQNLGQPFREDEDTEAMVHRAEEQKMARGKQGQM